MNNNINKLTMTTFEVELILPTRVWEERGYELLYPRKRLFTCDKIRACYKGDNTIVSYRVTVGNPIYHSHEKLKYEAGSTIKALIREKIARDLDYVQLYVYLDVISSDKIKVEIVEDVDPNINIFGNNNRIQIGGGMNIRPIITYDDMFDY